MEIGHKIKELRLRNDLTLSELASRCEVTKGCLSQLERDLTSPTITTLENILEALGTNLTEFFSEEPEEQVVFKKEDIFVDKRDNETIEWIVPNAQKNAMEPIIVTIKPHQRTSVISSHNGEEFGYVLKGRIILVSDHQYKVKAKEVFYISGKKSHYLYNPTDQDVRVLWITNPPMF